MRKETAEQLCLIAGGVLLLAAMCLYVYDRLEDARAGAEAASAVSQLRQSQSWVGELPPETEQETPELPAQQEGAEAPEQTPESPAPAAEREYLGILSIPALGLELPVQTEWSKAALRVSPCRQCGSVAGGDLVIAAHNYRSHFGRLDSLTEGDEIRLTTQDGAEAVYAVERLAQISPEEPDAVREGGCPLVLYTCTPGGKARVAVYCRQK